MGIMKRKLAIAAVLIFALVVGWYIWGAKSTPPGQPPLTTLGDGDLSEFQKTFDDNSAKVRLVLLLSPT
jgi:hypothetical protein